jgi:hypothetical protein
LQSYVSNEIAEAVDVARHPQSQEEVYASIFRIGCSGLRKVRPLHLGSFGNPSLGRRHFMPSAILPLADEDW